MLTNSNQCRFLILEVEKIPKLQIGKEQKTRSKRGGCQGILMQCKYLTKKNSECELS